MNLAIDQDFRDACEANCLGLTTWLVEYEQSNGESTKRDTYTIFARDMIGAREHFKACFPNGLINHIYKKYPIAAFE